MIKGFGIMALLLFIVFHFITHEVRGDIAKLRLIRESAVLRQTTPDAFKIAHELYMKGFKKGVRSMQHVEDSPF